MKPITRFVACPASAARKRRPLRHRLPAVFAALLAAAAVSHAAPITTHGTWWGTDGTDGTLRARDMSGNAVALNSASTAFFYDTTLNITWLADMNANGLMNWSTAVAWAEGLATGGFDDWRLPTIGPVNGQSQQSDFTNNGSTDVGYARSGIGWGTASEWGHLYYVTLGNLGFCAPNDAAPTSCDEQAGWGLANTAYFQNVQADNYWSDTEFVPDVSFRLRFRTSLGLQRPGDVRTAMYAVAVRSGDVLRDVGTVPEPQSLALALTALAGLGLGLRRRRGTR
jgi:hypothetical protein